LGRGDAALFLLRYWGLFGGFPHAFGRIDQGKERLGQRR
jgi:hypothetical protein